MITKRVVDNALLAKLGADAPLLAFCPNGVYYGVAPENATRYVLVYRFDGSHEETFDQPIAQMELIYLVKVVMAKSANGDMVGATQRVQDLLLRQPLPVAGAVASTHLAEDYGEVRSVEQDQVDPSILYFHDGDYYAAVVSPIP